MNFTKRSSKTYCYFLISFLFLNFPLSAGEEDFKDVPPIFISEQLFGLTSDVDHLIGGLISPLSGNPCLRKTDFIVKGAQEIPLNRLGN